jgi:hypothetical protein
MIKFFKYNQVAPIDNNECSICFQPLSIGKTIKLEGCLHEFHTICIHKWLKNQKNCPYCRSAQNNAKILLDHVEDKRRKTCWGKIILLTSRGDFTTK